MSQYEGTRVSAWARMHSFMACRYKVVALSLARRSFQSKLQSIIRTALAHKSAGLKSGHPHYKLLRQQADSLCSGFASRWNIDPNVLHAQIPAIGKLKSLADPAPKPKPAVMVSLGVICAVALFFLIGILAGLTSVGYHLIGRR